MLGNLGVLKVFLTHLAMEHEVVMKYVQMEVGKMDGPSLSVGNSIAARANSGKMQMASKSTGGQKIKGNTRFRNFL